MGTKHASIHVKLPTDEPVTAVGFNPNGRVLTVHVFRAVSNEYAPQACATKLIARGFPDNAARNWHWRSGWHRVILYGEFTEELREFATLLGFTVMVEDRPTST